MEPDPLIKKEATLGPIITIRIIFFLVTCDDFFFLPKEAPKNEALII
jgi:hypothetical protein